MNHMQSPPILCLTADPDFLALALAELRAAAPAAQILAEPEPGLLLIAGVDFFELAEAWRVQPPIFVRHICPVMAAYPLASRRSGYQPDDLVSQKRRVDSGDLRPDDLVSQKRHASSDDLRPDDLGSQKRHATEPRPDPVSAFNILR